MESPTVNCQCKRFDKSSRPISQPELAAAHRFSILEQEEAKLTSQIFYCAPDADKNRASQELPHNFGYDDEDSHYNFVQGDHIAFRYEVLDRLGSGTFGDVFKVYDHMTGLFRAIKIIRSLPRFQTLALAEIEMLKSVNQADLEGGCVVQLIDWFLFRKHTCLVFELLHHHLRRHVRKFHPSGLGVLQNRSLTKQLLQTLILFDSLGIVHCDLKPDNIMLTNAGGSFLKVIDMGLACYRGKATRTYTQTRSYRAPEVILAAGYTTSVDMWSLGCIVAELATGKTLFSGANEKEQLMVQMNAFGLPPTSLRSKSKRWTRFFDNETPLFVTNSSGKPCPPGARPLREQFADHPHFDHNLLDFLEKCLTLDPKERLSPQAALQHPFIAGKPLYPSVNALIQLKTESSSLKSSALLKENEQTTELQKRAPTSRRRRLLAISCADEVQDLSIGMPSSIQCFC